MYWVHVTPEEENVKWNPRMIQVLIATPVKNLSGGFLQLPCLLWPQRQVLLEHERPKHRTVIPMAPLKAGPFRCQWTQPTWFWTKQVRKWLDMPHCKQIKLTWITLSVVLHTSRDLFCMYQSALTYRGPAHPWGMRRGALGDQRVVVMGGHRGEPQGRMFRGDRRKENRGGQDQERSLSF